MHNSGVFDGGNHGRSTWSAQLPDEIPTQPGNAVRRASVAGAYRVGTPDTEPLYPAYETQPLTDNVYTGSRIALMLTALLVLGILGGVCCGYVLTLMHVNLTVLTSTVSSL
jgi:hypothetical protein